MEQIFKNELQLKNLINELQKNFKKEKINEIYNILYENTKILEENLPEGGYPNKPISGDTWILGAKIYDFCYDIFEIVKNNTDLDTEQKFLGIWNTVIFGIVSHYRSNVGVIMTEFIYFFERKGKIENIPIFAQAIFDDFELLIDDIYNETKIEDIDFDTIHGINYLIIACKKMIEYGNKSQKNQAENILKKIKNLPKKIQNLLDYDFNYKKGGKILKGSNF